MRLYCALITTLVFVFSLVSSPSADLFRWVDKEGAVHFTDNPHNIPAKHRGGAIRIKARGTPRSPESSKPYSRNKASVSFQKKGQIVIVQATVNGRIPANFVLDTGASHTMISRATAKGLGIDLKKKLPTIPFQTVNGIILAPLIVLDSMEVGGMQVKDLTAAVHDVFPDPNIAGLLGIDFLSNFNVNIDTKNKVLVLEKR